MATYRKKVAKKKARKKILKKVAKKVAKKRVVKTDAQKMKEAHERVEKDIENNGVTVELMLKKINSFKNKFAVGDYINLYHHYNDYEPDEYYYTKGQTSVEYIYKVTYVDSLGYFHYNHVNQDGIVSTYGNSSSEDVYELLDNYNCDLEYVDVDKMFKIDPDYVDSAILGTIYDPMAKLKLAQKEGEDAKLEEDKVDKLMVENYYKIKDYNKSIRIYSGGVRNVKTFKNKLKIGFEVYLHDTKLTVKVADHANDTFVFSRSNNTLMAVTTDDIKKLEFYSDEQQYPDYINSYLLKKYKPKKS